MVTVYLCGISVVFACLIGMPIAVWASTRERVWRGVEVIIDTLQTLPCFVYLMPVVMLFRVGDFTAILAVVAYALAPVIRYTGARPPLGRSAAGRGRRGLGLHAVPDPHQDQAQAGAAGDHARPQPDHHAGASRCW